MLLKFSYEMQDSFSQPVKDHHFSFMCIPRDTNRQRVLETAIEISPCTYRAEDKDFLGNRCVYGEAALPHTEFSVRISGVVETGLAPEEHTDTELNALFLLPTRVTEPRGALAEFISELVRTAPGSEYEKALHCLHSVYALLKYMPGTTNVYTTASEAFELGGGVCQDYAHIMLAALRSMGLPARYCVGMLVGEGASHAWVEVCCRGYWYGLDAVHDLLVDWRYIKLSHGRDYSDCIVNKGVFRGVCLESKQLLVSVSQTEENTESKQIQQ